MSHHAVDNVIIVMTDQQRADLSAREGFAVDCTPTLDALARSGRWFNRAYTAAPLCVPARISLLTGRFPSAHGVRENHGFQSPRRAEDLFDVARGQGLRTALIGKNHSHLTAERADRFETYGHLGQVPPLDDDSEAAQFDAWLHRLGARVATEASPFPVTAQMPSRIVDRGIDWLDESTTPGLLWLSFPEPHVPYQVPEPYFSRYTPATVPPPQTGPDDAGGRGLAWEWVQQLGRRLGDQERLERARANYVGMLRLVDDQIARLVAYLERSGKRDRTLIIALADHGDFAGEYGLLRKGPGIPEVLIRIPMLITGPGVSADPEPSPAHVSITDVVPTICDLAGWPVPEGVQGRSLAEVLRGVVPSGEFETAYAEQGVGGLPVTDPAELERLDAEGPGGVVATLCDVTQDGSLRMVRSGRWKLVVPVAGAPQLFDLERDPYELDDCYPDPRHAPTVARLMLQLTQWLVRVDDPLPIPKDGYPRRLHPRNYYWDSSEG